MEEAHRRSAALVVLALMLAGCAGAAVEPASTTERPFSGPAVPAGTYRLDDLFSHVLVNGTLTILPPELVELASEADGERLAFVLIRPDTAAQVPVIVEASPYYTDGTDPANIPDTFPYKRYAQNFVPHGYAVALIPVRGTADQGGCIDMHGPTERADLDQAVTWLGTQSWSNGNVGMIGLSYAGATGWEVAALGNPHLRTIVPIAGVNDMHDLLYRNGSIEARALYAEYETAYLSKGTRENNFIMGGHRAPARVATAVACPEIARGIAAAEHSALFPDEDPTGFWADRDQRPGVEENYRGSAFSIQGLQDWNVEPGHNYPWISSLEERGIVVKHMLGQWGHRFPDRITLPASYDDYRMDFSQVLLQWFDRWLKEDEASAIGPRVEVQDASRQWRSEDAWPPHDSTPLTLYLTPEGGLAREPSADAGQTPLAPDHVGAEPVDMDLGLVCVCATFTTDPFERDTRISGFVQVPLTVVPSGPMGHVAAWLYLVGAETGPERVGWGQLDLRFAEGDGVSRAVTPGAPMLARLQLEPIELVVPAGMGLSLLVHQGAHSDHSAGLLTGPVELQVGGEASAIVLPTIERDGSTFFAPPGVS